MMSHDIPLIITKVLRPARRADLLSRPRLVDFIHENIERKLILISASAGYGKTSLLTDYAHDTELPVCWYSLDASDRDPRAFLEYLLAAIRQRFPHFGQQTQGLIQEGGDLGRRIPAIVGALINEIYEDIRDFFVIVLDDYHAVDESEPINTILDSILRYLPDNCHIIVASRTVPANISLTQLIAHGQMAGLSANDLRFTAAEIQELMHRNHKVYLTDAQAREVALQSEGWITGILLGAYDMWQSLRSQIAAARGSDEQLFDYLTSEVFAQQPPDLQQFLVASSVLQRMSAKLCNRLLGIDNAQEILDSIEERSLFLVRLEGGWYRYHHLFQNFLRTRLERDEGAHRKLHLDAARLFESDGVLDGAIRHYLRAKAYDRVAAIMRATVGERYRAGQWETLSFWIDSLPMRVADAEPELLWYRAKIYAEHDRFPEALQCLDRAEVSLKGRGDMAGLARVLIQRSTVFRLEGQYRDAIGQCQQVLSMLDDETDAAVPDAHRTMGICYQRLGDFARSATFLERALRLYQRTGSAYNVAMTHYDLGSLYGTMGNLGRSSHHLSEALRLWQDMGHPRELANVHNSLGVVLHDQGDYQGALAEFEQALEQAQQSGFLRIEATVRASKADVHRDQGDYERALEEYRRSLETAERAHHPFIITYALTGMGNVWRLMGNQQKANAAARQALEKARTHASEYELGLSELTLGIICYERGDLDGGLRYVQKAAERFRRGRATRELARAYFHLAQIQYRMRSFRRALENLRRCADLVLELGHSQFLLVDNQRSPHLLTYAVSRVPWAGRLAALLGQGRKPAGRMEGRVSESPPDVLLQPRLEIFAFGRAEVFRDNQLVPHAEWVTSAAKEMLFYFLAFPEGLRKEQVTTTFWPDTSPAKSHSRFHVALYHIRRVLGGSHTLLYESGGRYCLAPTLVYWFDVAEFERCLANVSGEDIADPDAAGNLRRAIELYRGDYLDEFYSDWCIPVRERLRQQYLAALADLAQYHARRSEYQESIQLCQAILARDEYCEQAHRNLIRYYALVGDRASAIRQYDLCVRLLREDLGVEPLPETHRVYEGIINDTFRRDVSGFLVD